MGAIAQLCATSEFHPIFRGSRHVRLAPGRYALGMSTTTTDGTPDRTSQLEALLRDWALNDEERIALRGHDESDNEQAERLGILRAIAGGLYLLFPENPGIRREWVRRENFALGWRSPLQVILAEENGLQTVAQLIHAQLQV